MEMEKKEEKVTECGGFWRVLMTFPSISVKIIASASVHMRLETLGWHGDSDVDCSGSDDVCVPLRISFSKQQSFQGNNKI